MVISEIFNLVFEEDLGWRPMSGSIKPVHLANGLARAIQGGPAQTSDLNRLIVWTKQGQEIEDRSLDALLASSMGPAISAFSGDLRGFERMRRFARGILNADNAVFPTAASYTLTCGQMVTSDWNDHGLGDAVAELVRDTDLAEVLRERLAAGRPQDPASALAWPVLDMSELPRGAKERRHRRGRERGGVRAEIKGAAECLATHERAQGNNLRTLQRAVQFGAAAALAFVQALAGDAPLDERAPGLLVMSERRRSDLARASERSLDRILDRFEDWLGDRIGALIDEGAPLREGERPLTASEDVRTVTRIFQKINKKREKKQEVPPTEADVKQRLQFWREVRIRDESLTAGQRLGRALVLAQRREVDTGTPREFVTALSRRAGLLFPPFQGRSQHKRLKPSVLMLDALVRACVPAGKILPLEEFLERLWRRFGLLVGGRRSPTWDDAELLERHEIHVDPHDLSLNTEQFVDELASMGLARRFPDDVAFIGDGYDR